MPGTLFEIEPSLLDFGVRRLADYGADQLVVGVPLLRALAIVQALKAEAGELGAGDR